MNWKGNFNNLTGEKMSDKKKETITMEVNLNDMVEAVNKSGKPVVIEFIDEKENTIDKVTQITRAKWKVSNAQNSK